jgi:enamine deaminase RidA (YjgF/YER057c/UK114 family)
VPSQIELVNGGASATLGDIVKMNVYMTNLDQIDKFRKAGDEYVPKSRLPATTLVGVTGLAMNELLIEIGQPMK